MSVYSTYRGPPALRTPARDIWLPNPFSQRWLSRDLFATIAVPEPVQTEPEQSEYFSEQSRANSFGIFLEKYKSPFTFPQSTPFFSLFTPHTANYCFGILLLAQLSSRLALQPLYISLHSIHP